ncbi:MAG: hypothetical protein ACSHX6_09400 [Akkermansiaceae bacterium]
MEKPHYITRLSYNSAEWRRPTRDAQDQESGGTYNAENGFGHEDWLFRNEWMLDGWKYGFVQGVNRSHDKLIKAGEAFDLTLFTIRGRGDRYYVATIRDVECLNDQLAGNALEAFNQRGWTATMRDEIRNIGGNEAALGNAQAKLILNLRFRWENIEWRKPDPINQSDPVSKLTRYTLNSSIPLIAKINHANFTRKGSLEPPIFTPYLRPARATVICTPEHARMQAILMAELRKEYPEAEILAEQDYIDVQVRTETKILLFELKSDLAPLTVIRLALGQILEYAYHPNREHSLPLELFIVGRRDLSEEDSQYLNFLRSQFKLPINYRVIHI